ncbi:MAG: hypothetical protein AB8E82_18105 [Aureispira sp.]
MKLILLLLLLPTITLLGQVKIQDIQHYWMGGQKIEAKCLAPSTFYLTLHNESIKDSTKNLKADQALKQHLQDYEFTIAYQGFADDHVGFVFYRKLVFKHPPLTPEGIQKLYQAVYSYNNIQFFGPLVANIYSNQYYSGAGLLHDVGLQFKPDLEQEQIDALIQKYQLTVTATSTYNKEIDRKVINGTQYTKYQQIRFLEVQAKEFHGLFLLALAEQLQQEPLIDRVSNRLFIQETY